MPPFIHCFVLLALVGAVGFWRYDSLNLGFFEPVQDAFPRIVRLVGQKSLNMVKDRG